MLWREWRALLASAKFHGYVLAGALGSAPFFTFLGGGPYVVVTLMGRSSAEFGLWFAVTSFGYMSGNFTASRLSQRFGVDAMIMAGVGVRADRRGARPPCWWRPCRRPDRPSFSCRSS